MRRVIIESPYAGDVAKNRAYLDRCILDSLRRGEAPMASHKMYTAALDDSDPAQRAQGFAAGFAWGAVADAAVFYTDLGWSPGMIVAKKHWEATGTHIEERCIGARSTEAVCGWCFHFHLRGSVADGYGCTSSRSDAQEWFSTFMDARTGVLNCAAEGCPGFTRE